MSVRPYINKYSPRAARSARAAMEKLNDPGDANSLLSAGDIKKGGGGCGCIGLPCSSSRGELKSNLVSKILSRILVVALHRND